MYRRVLSEATFVGFYEAIEAQDPSSDRQGSSGILGKFYHIFQACQWLLVLLGTRQTLHGVWESRCWNLNLFRRIAISILELLIVLRAGFMLSLGMSLLAISVESWLFLYGRLIYYH
jgi:hypothetical protein